MWCLDIELQLHLEPLLDARVRAELHSSVAGLGPDFGLVELSREDTTELLGLVGELVMLAGAPVPEKRFGNLRVRLEQGATRDSVAMSVVGMGLRQHEAELSAADAERLESALRKVIRLLERAHDTARKLAKN